MNRIPSITRAFLAVLLIGSLAFGADIYKVDMAHSEIGFTVSHMMVSKVRGNFRDYTIELKYDEKDISKSSVSAAIKVASIDTDNEKRDGHLKNPDFFDAEKHPQITFMSKEVRKTKDGFSMLGSLKMRDVEKIVEIPFNIVGKVTDMMGNTRVGFEGRLIIDRQDFGVAWSKKLDAGGLVVGDEVKIEIIIEAVKEK